MANPDKLIATKKFQVKPNSKVDLTRVATKPDQKLSRQESEVLLGVSRKELAKIHDERYAHNEYSVLLIFQAMDAAGNDGAVKHIMSGFNPLGVKVTSFKTRTSHELDHDFFWRHYRSTCLRRCHVAYRQFTKNSAN